jgi:hypothetical protein
VTPTPSATDTSASHNHAAAVVLEHQLSDISSDDEDGDPLLYRRHSQEKMSRSKSINAVERNDEAASMEDDFLFEYDGVVISTKACTFDARSRMHQSQVKKNAAAEGSGKVGPVNKFSFGDFKVNVIDEIDELPPRQSPSSAEEKKHHHHPDPQQQQELQDIKAEGGGPFFSPLTANPTSNMRDRFGSPSTVGTPRKGYTEVRRFTVSNLLGHASRVKCIAIAPNEREYVSCSNEDASVTLFNFATGREVSIFTGHQDTVINAAFSSDGKYLATTSRDHTMILWDVVTAKQILTFDHAKVVICCCFSKDSRYVATGCQDKVCRLWETRKGREHLVFAQHEGIVISMSYAPDNQHIVSASADKTLRVWSTSTAKCRFTLIGHVGIVLVCNYTSDGKYIISNDEKLLKIWSASDGICTKTLQVEDLPVMRGVSSAPNAKKTTWTLSCPAPGDFSRYLFVACNNRFVYMLDIVTGEEVSHVFCKAPVYCLAMGHRLRVSFGDSFGNVYLVSLK